MEITQSDKIRSQKKEIIIALAGNPNCGKTTLFNELTGSHQHVGNWPGVTVEHKEGIVRKNGYTFRIIDLPGIYSLSAYSQEEVIARNFLIHNKIDVIINVVDASSLERNLYLTTQLLELELPMIIALNMIDMAEKLGQVIDMDKMSGLLGVDVVPTQASKGDGTQALLDRAVIASDCAACPLPRSARHNPEIESEISKIEDKLKTGVLSDMPVRWLIVKSLEGDEDALKMLGQSVPSGINTPAIIKQTQNHLEEVFGDDIEVVIADGRYGFIGGLLREAVTKTAQVDRYNMTDNLDNILLNRVLGMPIFLLLMWLTFKLTFDIGGYFNVYLSKAVTALGVWAAAVLPAGPLSSLVVNGVINGVGGVVVFLPNIAVMFAIISILEDSGYMARAAFLMDKSMHMLGLHGKSFIPMIMGFGCNVPAIMATRTLEAREDRILTILITPLMSCTARLPIYILFTGVFFSKSGAWIVFSLYAIGVILAVVSGKIFRKIFFHKAISPFVMELPPYRLPTLKGTLIHVWERTSLFLSKAGTVILAASVIIWALGSLPMGVHFGSSESLAGHLGRLLEPLVKPLGMDWRAAVALFFGLGAKEIVVSTIGVLYGGQGEAGLNSSIANSFTPVSAFTFMIVSLIYVPCIATIAAIKRETNSWKWTTVSVVYSLILAYGAGFAFYYFAHLAGFR